MWLHNQQLLVMVVNMELSGYTRFLDFIESNLSLTLDC